MMDTSNTHYYCINYSPDIESLLSIIWCSPVLLKHVLIQGNSLSINPPAVLSIRFLTLQPIDWPFFLRDDELSPRTECKQTVSAQCTIAIHDAT